jgi:tetratricopeptide (TPR) repeat protein
MHVGRSYNTLGEFHRYTEDLDEALMDYHRAYELFEQENNYYWQAKSLAGRGETYRRLALQAKSRGNRSSHDKYGKKALKDMKASLYLCERYQLDDERDTTHRRLGRLLHDSAIDQYEQGDKKSAEKYLEKAYKYFKSGLEYAEKTKEILEKFENLTEQAFLLDDAIAIFGQGNVPNHYQDGLPALQKALKEHTDGSPRTHRYPVFEALLKLAQGDVAFANGEYDQALHYYLNGYKELGTLQGYGVARYKQHFPYLTRQIGKLPMDDQKTRWCQEFIQTWTETPSGKGNKTLAEELIPDMVGWCNRMLMTLGNKD